MHNLVELGQGVFAWVHTDPRFGHSNVGLIIDGDGLTVIDTTATPEQGALVRADLTDLTADLGLPIRRVVLTSSRVAFCGGSTAFWPAAYYGTETVSDALDTPADPEIFRRLLPDLAPAYHDEFTTRPITHTVAERAWLTPAAELLPLPGESAGNLAVVVPAAGVVFAGALASFGVTPLAFDADLDQWIRSLDTLTRTAPTVVPGHGPLGGVGDLGDLATYLQACVDAGASGPDTPLAPGPWDHWTDRRFHPVNVERAARLHQGDPSVPTSMLRLLGLA